jgi:hypothetical protein
MFQVIRAANKTHKTCNELDLPVVIDSTANIRIGGLIETGQIGSPLHRNLWSHVCEEE